MGWRVESLESPGALCAAWPQLFQAARVKVLTGKGPLLAGSTPDARVTTSQGVFPAEQRDGAL